mgnify:FL=1
MGDRAGASAPAKAWEAAKGGEGSSSDPLATRFVESLSIDTRLYEADIAGSLAHARMLHSVGLISEPDLRSIERGFGEIKREIESAPAGPTAVGVPGAWPGWKTELEDVHMCLEAALIEKVGDPGRRLHTGRSRNDQVALDLRLYLREACCELAGRLDSVSEAFEELAARQGDVLLPSYTPLPRARPAGVGGGAWAWWSMFRRDEESIIRLASDPLGLAASPLGAGAIAGSILPLDRDMTTKGLGLKQPVESSIDATASRDEALDFLYACARIGVHLSRWAEQWILYCSTEFGFLSLAPEHTTGSSMMPQKRNPDMLELIRGRGGSLSGHLVALLTICKGLPIGYNRDLQEDKRSVFAAFDLTRDCLEMAARVIRGATFRPQEIARSGGGLDRGYPDATALAEMLVLRGVPFRTAHQIVGSLVRACDQSGRGRLMDLTIDEINAEIARHGFDQISVKPDILESLGAAGVVRSYRSPGNAGTTPGNGGYRDWLARLGRASKTDGAAPLIGSPAGAPQAETSGLFGSDESRARVRSSAKREPVDALNTAIIAAYEVAGRTLDDLPYTPEFDGLYQAVRSHEGWATVGTSASEREVLRRLHNLRKAGRLPKIGKAAVHTSPVKLSPEEEQTLAGLVIEVSGTLGQRDQLPYTDRFEAVVREFNQRTARAMTPHDVWRLVAKLAK